MANALCYKSKALANGKDGVDSRSLEKLTLATSLLLRHNLELQVKI